MKKQTETAMEIWAMDNIRLAITTNALKSPVPDQADITFT